MVDPAGPGRDYMGLAGQVDLSPYCATNLSYLPYLWLEYRVVLGKAVLVAQVGFSFQVFPDQRHRGGVLGFSANPMHLPLLVHFQALHQGRA